MKKGREYMKQRGAYGRQNNELEDRNFEMTLLEENKMKRAKKFIGLKIISESLCIKKEEQNNMFQAF